MFAVLAVLLLAGPLAAQPAREAPSREQLREAERAAAANRAAAAEAAREAAEAAAEERRLAEQRVAAARRVQAAEAEIDAAQARAAAAEAASQTAAAEADRRASVLAPMLPVMRRLSLWPVETLLVVPAPPEQALRGALVLQGLVRNLRHEADALRLATAEAAARAGVAREEARRLAEATAEGRRIALLLDAEITGARARQAEARDVEREAARRAQQDAARAQDLSDMLGRLAREEARERAEAAARERAETALQARRERERLRAEARAGRRAGPDAPPAAPEPAPRIEASLAPRPVVPGSGRAMPVAGRIAHNFGDAAEAGPARGITFSAPSGARVVSPCSGRAVFSGPFRSYGLMLIVDCGEGHHFVLAGLERLDAAVGTRLLAGEPVGVLGTAGADGRRGSLYLELRRNGQPVDPRPWLAQRG